MRREHAEQASRADWRAFPRHCGDALRPIFALYARGLARRLLQREA
jgi:hypothetical protein